VESAHGKQEGAAVEGPPAMGPSLQLSMCMLFWGFLGLFVPAVEGIGLVTKHNKYRLICEPYCDSCHLIAPIITFTDQLLCCKILISW